MTAANGRGPNGEAENAAWNQAFLGPGSQGPAGQASRRVGEPGPSNANGKNISSFSNHSYMSSSMNQGENIYDSKLNEERPKINKSLGKH